MESFREYLMKKRKENIKKVKENMTPDDIKIIKYLQDIIEKLKELDKDIKPEPIKE